MKRKIISLLLCLVMALSLIPTVAFAGQVRPGGDGTSWAADHIDVDFEGTVKIGNETVRVKITELSAVVDGKTYNDFNEQRDNQWRKSFSNSSVKPTLESKITINCKLVEVVSNGETPRTWDFSKEYSGTALTDAQNYCKDHSGFDFNITTDVQAQIEKINIPVSKVWVNVVGITLPSSVTVTLYANGQPTNKVITLTANADESLNWKGVFTGIDKFDEQGAEITYTVSEAPVLGYTAEVTGSASEGFTVTNTYTPATTSVTVTKVWNDDNNSLNKRPESVTVELLANGTKEKEKVLTSTPTASWTATFENLPVKDSEGKHIAYTVREKDVPGYTPQVIEPGKPVVTVGALTKVPKCNFTTFDTEGANLVIAKLTENEGYVVWTVTEPTDYQQDTLRELVKSQCNNNAGKDVSFIFGDNKTHKSEKGTATFTSEKLTFDKENVWSMFWYGNVTVSQPNNGFTIVNTLNKGNDVNKYATLTITKVDAKDKKTLLPGAVFTLTKDGETVGTSTTNNDGTCTFTGLTEGTYTLAETTAPKGYQLPGRTWTFRVTLESTVTELNEETNSYVTTKTYGIQDISSDSVTTRAVSYPQDLSVTIENTMLSPTEVNIPITKTVSAKVGSTLPKDLPNFTFQALLNGEPVGELKLNDMESNGNNQYTGILKATIPAASLTDDLVVLTIKEIPGIDTTKWDYDTKVYTVTVVNGQTAENPVVREIKLGDKVLNSVSFENVYTYKYTPAPRPTTPTKPVTSVKTGDMGVALYAGLAILSMTGSAGVILRRRKNDK